MAFPLRSIFCYREPVSRAGHFCPARKEGSFAISAGHVCLFFPRPNARAAVTR